MSTNEKKINEIAHLSDHLPNHVNVILKDLDFFYSI